MARLGQFIHHSDGRGQKAGDFPLRKPGEPSVTKVTRRIEFQLLYPWQATPLGHDPALDDPRYLPAGITRAGGSIRLSGTSSTLVVAGHRHG